MRTWIVVLVGAAVCLSLPFAGCGRKGKRYDMSSRSSLKEQRPVAVATWKSKPAANAIPVSTAYRSTETGVPGMPRALLIHGAETLSRAPRQPVRASEVLAHVRRRSNRSVRPAEILTAARPAPHSRRPLRIPPPERMRGPELEARRATRLPGSQERPLAEVIVSHASDRIPPTPSPTAILDGKEVGWVSIRKNAGLKLFLTP